MDFRLPQPVKYSLKKKKRRWKLLREETKKLSLKNHKRNASCQTDSSESSESSGKKINPQVLTGFSVSSENCTLINHIGKENLPSVSVCSNDEKTVHSIYHFCTPARRKTDKDIIDRSYNQVYSSVISTSKSTAEDMTSFTAVTESNSVFIASSKITKSGTILNGSKKKTVQNPQEKPLHQIENGKHQSSAGYNLSPSSSTKTMTSERISQRNANDLTCSKDSTGMSSKAKSNNKYKPSKNKHNSPVLLSDSDTSVSSISINSKNNLSPSKPEVLVVKGIELDLDKTTSSDMSQLILDSSVSSGDRIKSSKTLGHSTNKLQTVQKPLARSSVLNKRFNNVVESDFALSSNVNDFYLRVKRRVLGLHNNNSGVQDKSDLSDGIILEENEDGGGFNRLSNGNKENSNRSIPKGSIQRISSDFKVGKNISVTKTPLSPTPIENHKIKHLDKTVAAEKNAEINSPEIVLLSDDSLIQNKADVPEKGGKSHPNESILRARKKFVIPESSDSENTSPTAAKVSNSRFRRKSRVEQKKSSKSNVEPVVLDSELSSSSGGIEYRRKRAVFVIGSSDSESSALSKSDDQDDVDLINDFHESDLEMHESDSEGSVRSQEKQLAAEEEIRKSGSSDLFRHVTKRALVLDSSGSPSVGEKKQEIVADQLSTPKVKGNDVFNLLYKPGFSTLSQSKHEDIKNWLSTISCSSSGGSVDSKKTADTSVKKAEEDNINLTDMEQVLNELYGKDWGDKKNFTPKVLPKKKESQIIVARLTDSDDSSTPPLPPSTPKRRLFNQKNNFFTPKETPTLGKKNIFTPLTSVGKKGATNIFKTPKTVGSKSKTGQAHLGSDAFSSPVLTFVASLSVGHQSVRCHPEAKYFVKNFKSKKEELARKLFHLFNDKVFSSKLPHDMPLLWNNRLRKTAGYCYNRRIKSSDGTFTRSSRVELSSKIVDNTARLRDTLIHELCHAATWIISEVTGGHGPTWKRWTNKAMREFPELPPISRCHNYDIITKYKYKCSSCNYSIGRHSKSLDVQRKVCGICGGKFELFLNKTDESGKPMPNTPRTPNAFALFVKENYGSTKKSKDNLKHKDVMKMLSLQFAATKITTAIPEQKDC